MPTSRSLGPPIDLWPICDRMMARIHDGVQPYWEIRRTMPNPVIGLRNAIAANLTSLPGHLR